MAAIARLGNDVRVGDYLVSPTGDGQWAVHAMVATTPVSRHPDEADAIRAATRYIEADKRRGRK